MVLDFYKEEGDLLKESKLAKRARSFIGGKIHATLTFKKKRQVSTAHISTWICSYDLVKCKKLAGPTLRLVSGTTASEGNCCGIRESLFQLFLGASKTRMDVWRFLNPLWTVPTPLKKTENDHAYVLSFVIHPFCQSSCWESASSLLLLLLGDNVGVSSWKLFV